MKSSEHKLSVVIPVFNERNTVEKLLQRVLDVQMDVELEIVVVDDGSTDGTREVLAQLDNPRIQVFLQPENRGKGAAAPRARG